MEQTEFELSPPYNDRTSGNRQEIRVYKTWSRIAEDLDKIPFEKEKANESTPQNIRRGPSENTFAKNFQFLTTLLPLLFVPVSFLCTLLPPPPQRMFAIVTYKKRKFCEVYEFFNKKSGSEKREKSYLFCTLNIKDQFFLHIYMYTVTIRTLH